MASIIVLGTGMVGSTMALDLSVKHQVTAADRDPEALSELKKRASVDTVLLDFSDLEAVRSVVQPFDLVVGAVPGFLGFEMLRTVIGAGKDIVDISFCAENALELDELARKHKVTCIVDIGVAPGVSNLVLGYHDRFMQVDSFECLVGGLPLERNWPFEYKAPFSPIDVIEEYTRPARFIENGMLVTRPALSEPEWVQFSPVGTLESFNTDGLRSLLFTMPHIPNMKEKTLRYPGHIQWIQGLMKSGFFSEEPVQIADTRIRPIDFTTRILFENWSLGKEEQELTVMRITIDGLEAGTQVRYQYELFATYDTETAQSSMARSTGYTCTAAAQLVIDRTFTAKGVFPPEKIGCHENCFMFIMKYMEERGIVYKKNRAIIPNNQDDRPTLS